MMKATRTALIAAAVLTLGIPAAHAGVHFSIGIGVPFPVAPVAVAPVAVPPPPAYGMVYQPGYYAWTGAAYAWVPGVWARPPYRGAVWIPAGWARHGYGRVWVGGHWH
jgi:hypothetical protein